MSIYNKLLQSIKKTLSNEFRIGKEDALLNEIKIMGGGFNGMADVLNFSSDAPCVSFGIRGVPKNERNYGNQLESVADISLYLITSEFGKANTGDAILEAYELLEKLQLIIKNGMWGLQEVDQTEPDSIVCTNYYAPEFYQNGIALWEITWRVKILLGQNKWEQEPIEITQATARTDIQADAKTEEVIIKIGQNEKYKV